MAGPTSLLATIALLLAAASASAQPDQGNNRHTEIRGELSQQLERIRAAQIRAQELSATLAELEGKPRTSTIASKVPVFVRVTPSPRSEPIGKVVPGQHIVVLRALESPWFEVLAKDANLYGFAMLHASQVADPSHIEHLLLLEAEFQLQEEAKRVEQQRHGEHEELQRQYSDCKEGLSDFNRCNHLIEQYGLGTGARIAKREVWKGMTVQQAFHAWGAPMDIDVEATAAGRSETWEYSDGRSLHFVNEQLLDVIEP